MNQSLGPVGDRQIARQNDADSEQDRRIVRYQQRWQNRPPKAHTSSLSDEGDHPLDLLARYAEATGSVSQDFRSLILKQLAGVFTSTGMTEDTFLDAGLAFLHGLEPEDELEGALCVQLFGLHCLAMEMMRRALLANNTYGQEIPKLTDANINRADKLLRAFRETSAALQKHRGKGSQQKVIVEHVNVNEGGKAIVGTISQERGDTDNR